MLEHIDRKSLSTKGGKMCIGRSMLSPLGSERSGTTSPTYSLLSMNTLIQEVFLQRNIGLFFRRCTYLKNLAQEKFLPRRILFLDVPKIILKEMSWCYSKCLGSKKVINKVKSGMFCYRIEYKL